MKGTHIFNRRQWVKGGEKKRRFIYWITLHGSNLMIAHDMHLNMWNHSQKVKDSMERKKPQ